MSRSMMRHPNDTGSAEVQIELLTRRIEKLTLHFKTHKKDFHSQRGLTNLVSRRKSFIAYLQKRNPAKLVEVKTFLNLR